MIEHCEEKLKALLEASEDLIFILDKNGCFSIVNDNGARSLDYNAQELIGKHFLELVDGNEKASALKIFQDLLNQTGTISFPTTLISKFGKEINYTIFIKALKEGNVISEVFGLGKILSKELPYEEKINELNNKIIEYKRLISIERERSAKQKSMLEEWNKVKREFISNISHGLRTPLASIIGFSEAISSDPNLPDEMKSEFIKIILNEGKRLAKMIDEVLDVSHSIKSDEQANFKEFDISKLLKENIDQNSKTIKLRKIKLSSELPDEEITFWGDKERISYIFTHLIENAIKYTGEGGRIKIILQSLYKEIEVIITDTGIGIPEYKLPYIFKKYNKLNYLDEGSPTGGLGLVFVKKIVDLHKGLISVQSEVNNGTSFTVKLPNNIKNKNRDI